MSLYRYLGTIVLALVLLLVPSGLSVGAQATAGITITPSTAVTTTEAGGTATFTVVLNSQPTGNVSVGFVSSDPAEAILSPTTLSFSSATWNNPQRVTVKGVDDQVTDGTISYTIITTPLVSTDRNYAGINPADIAGTNTDNDTAGFRHPDQWADHQRSRRECQFHHRAVEQADAQRQCWRFELERQ